MKIVFISDIHGDEDAMNKVDQLLKTIDFDYLVCCGDVLNHGPRNPLPQRYNPPAVAEMLNFYKNKIVACRGNCDSEVDQMLLKFPMLAGYTILNVDQQQFFITHGHNYNAEALPEFLSEKTVFVQGHTHIEQLELDKNHNIICLNPGSISLPKGQSKASYALYENQKIMIKELASDQVVCEYLLT